MFIAAPTAGTAPITVSFTDTSTGAPTGWLWDFGDGSTSTSQNPTHTYNSDGVYLPSLEVTKGATTSSTTSLVSIVAPAPYTAASYTGTTTAPFEVTGATTLADGSTITNWYWEWGDGMNTDSGIPAASHTYSNPGVYNILLTITYTPVGGGFQRIARVRLSQVTIS